VKDLPRLSTIPAGEAFTDALARGIVEAYAKEDNPLALTNVLILLPTRRAVRSLTEAFGRVAQEQGREALLLPQIQPIGDVDEEALALEMPLEGFGVTATTDLNLPAPIDSMERDFELAGLIAKLMAATGTPVMPDQAVEMARSLARFLDTVHTERVSLEGLDDLVPEQFAENWQHTIKFLKIIREAWPAHLQEQSKLDPADRRNRLLEALGSSWTATPPSRPVIAAGTTGSLPATADLLKVIAGLDQGHIVLPGVDLEMSPRAWGELEPSHPQIGMAFLLQHLEAERSDVALWPSTKSAAHPRQRLINEALRPSAATDEWIETANALSDEGACEGLSFIVAQHSSEEARAIALALREAVETPNRTAALVTPDRNLARRVSSELKRFDLIIDDSAGSTLDNAAPATFFLHLIDAISSDWSAIPALSLLKHPFFHAQQPRGSLRAEIDALEEFGFRGVRHGSGLPGLKTSLIRIQQEKPRKTDITKIDRALELVDRLIDATADITAMVSTHANTGTWMQAHCDLAVALVTDETGTSDRLWEKSAGEALSKFINEVLAAPDSLGLMDVEAYAHLIRSLMAGRPVRAQEGAHPRLSIWGPMEARLQQTDLMILGGLTERIWPAEVSLDPWLSRPMRTKLGLSSPERQIGLSAHDFAQLAASPEVILSRSEKVDGQPAVPSRWWLRLENLLKGSSLPDIEEQLAPYASWARQLDKPAGAPTPVAAPSPTPPVKSRPRKMSVTDVEKWIRDPYSIYAKHILGLYPLDNIDREAGPAERGTLIHDIMDDFTKAHPKDLPANGLEELVKVGAARFEAFKDKPEVMAIWWPRFERIASWVIEFEIKHRAATKQALPEQSGVLTFKAGKTDFTLRGRADRIDLYEDGTLGIIDYKTGAIPKKDACETGLAPQVTLEAAMAARGGFGEDLKSAVSHLIYIGLKGSAQVGEVRVISAEEDRTLDLAENAFENFIALIQQFDELERPYPSQPRPRLTNIYGDYDQLARRLEWSIGGADDGGGNGGGDG